MLALLSNLAIWTAPIAAMVAGAGACTALLGWPAGLLFLATSVLLPGLTSGLRGNARSLALGGMAALLGAGYAGLGLLMALVCTGQISGTLPADMTERGWNALLVGGAVMLLWDNRRDAWDARVRRRLDAQGVTVRAPANVVERLVLAGRLLATSVIGLIVAVFIAIVLIATA